MWELYIIVFILIKVESINFRGDLVKIDSDLIIVFIFNLGVFFIVVLLWIY